MIYESEVLFKLMERDGFNIPSSIPPYESEIKAYLINQVKLAYPKLTDYEAEWLLYNYTKHLPADFPISSVTNVTNASFENVVPFAYQTAILKGNTMVNLCNTKNRSETLTADSRFLRCNIPQALKANAIYTFIVTITNSTTTNPIRAEYKHPDDTNSYSTLMDAGKNGIVNINISNNKDITKINIFLPDKETGQVVISDVMIIEGDYTGYTYVSYFQGIQSVKMPVLTTVGKNLAYLEQGYINPENGNDSSREGSIRTKHISIDPQLRYTIYGLNEGAPSFLAFYDCNKNFISRTTGAKRKEMVIIPTTTPTNARYVRLTNYGSDENSVTLDTPIMMEQGYPTSYEPFKSNILTVNEDVTLRSNESVCDELDLLTGKLTQRIDEDGEILTQEVVKTVDLKTINENGESVYFMPLEGTMHVSCNSQTIQPTFDMSVPVEATTQNLASFIDLEMEE